MKLNRAILTVLVCVLVSCAPVNQTPALPSVKPSTTAPALAADTATAALTPTSQPLNTYTDTQIGVSLQYPPDWQPDPGGGPQIYGPDGLFMLESYGAYSAFTLEQICAAAAGPAQAGAQPYQMLEVGNEPACLTLTFENPPYQLASLVIAHPLPDGRLHFLHLLADEPHILSLAETLQWQAQDGSSPAPLPEPGQQTFASGLVVESYPLYRAEAGGVLPEGFRPVPAAALEPRRAWREAHPERLSTANQALAPFGYHLDADTLYQGNQPVLRDIRPVSRVSVNASGTDFVLVVRDAQENDHILRRGSEQSVRGWLPVAPVFVGDDLLAVDEQGRVLRAEQVVYEGNLALPPGVSQPRLWSWDGHWVVELQDSVLVDGASLNEIQGYEETFGWQLLDGRPFYFFKRDGRMGISFDGEILPLQFESVVHYACCSGAAYNLQGNDVMASFFAVQDGVFMYVEAGVYR